VLQAPQACNWPLSHILQPPAAISWGLSLGPTDIAPHGRDFRFRAPNRPPPAYLGFQAPQAHNWPLTHILKPPAIVSWGRFLGPADIEPVGLNFWVRASNQPPLAHLAFQAPQARIWPLARTLQHPATISRGCTPGPTDTEPRGLGFRSRAPNRPPCASRASGPPGPQMAPLPHSTTPCYRQLGW
jgi:hypothetical protein